MPVPFPDRVAARRVEIKGMRGMTGGPSACLPRALDPRSAASYIRGMDIRILLLAAVGIAALADGPAFAQSARASAAIDQIAPPPAAVSTRVVPIDPSRSSKTEQAPIADASATALTPAQLAACRAARAESHPDPKGLDCTQVSAAPAVRPPPRVAAPTAETSLLGMLGETFDTGAAPVGDGGAATADQVARQLSTGVVQGSVGSDAAASIARDRAAAPPASSPPPPQR